jgi:hypothetical protein
MNIGKALTRALSQTGLAILSALLLLSIMARTPGPQGRWAYNVLLGVDLFINAVMMGDPRETISSRLGKWQQGSHWTRRQIADVLCPITSVIMAEYDHCQKSVDREHGRDSVLPW